MPADIANRFADFKGGQVDLTGLSRSELLIPDGLNESGRVAIWKKGALAEGVQPQIPANVLHGVMHGLWLYAEITSPSVTALKANCFTNTWRSLMGKSVIPFDYLARRELFASTYKELHDYVHKWEALKNKGWNGLRTMFQKTTEQGFHLQL
jgi:hypothetical protein